LVVGTWTNGVLSASAGIGNPTIVISPPLANGWYRLDITATPAVAGDSFSLLFYPESSGGGTSGLTTLVYGFQVTDTPFGVDYIPTTTAAATQAADSFSFPFTQTTCSLLANTINQNYDGTGNQRILGVGPNGYAPIYISSPINFASFGGGLVTGPAFSSLKLLNKTMAAGDTSTTTITSNGLTPVSGAGAFVPSGTTMYIGNDRNGSDFAYGEFEAIGIWNGLVASAAEMQRLTTP
jgi:hypothetical protein